MQRHLSELCSYPLGGLQTRLELLWANADRSAHGSVLLDQWLLQETRADGIALTCRKHLAPVNTDLTVRIDYTQRDQLLEQKITIHQQNAASLYVGLTQDFHHAETDHLWSFDCVHQESNCVYGSGSNQAFPAAGMVLCAGEILGILMDTGIANEWSRWHLRRTSGGNAPVVTAYDPVLMEALPAPQGVRLRAGQYFPTHDISSEEQGDDFLRLLCRKEHTHLFECDAVRPCQVAAEYPDGRVATYAIDSPGRQVITLPPQTESGFVTLRWTDGALVPVGLFERQPELRPWHLLRQDEPRTYRYFLYADRFTLTLRDLRKHAQLHLAEALDFTGTDAEKILYADFRMLNWQAEPGMSIPLCVPSIDYFEMYFRDIFWSANGVDDPELNHTLLQMVSRTMDERGWVDNIITPFFGSIEKVDNEINYLYVIWSWLNLKRFGYAPDMERIARVVRLVMDRYDPARTGVILTNNPQSLMDVMWQDHPCRFAVSQGYYALTMRIALDLGIDGVDAAYAEKAAAAYRDYYGPGRDGRCFLHTFPGNKLGQDGSDLDIVSCLDLEPEFLSLFCLGESLLGGQIVRDTLDCIPVFCDCLMPIIGCTDGSFFTRECNPFNDSHYWEAGRYANGGSYLRPQYIVLATGAFHGWEPADRLMHLRLRAEMETCETSPVSMEYLHTLGDPGKSSNHKVFAWNVFVCQINRWIRETLDPSFNPGDDIR